MNNNLTIYRVIVFILLLVIAILIIMIVTKNDRHILILRSETYPVAGKDEEDPEFQQHIIEYVYNGDYKVYETFMKVKYQDMLEYLGEK